MHRLSAAVAVTALATSGARKVETLCKLDTDADAIEDWKEVTLDGDTVLVTGGDSGLGYALAGSLAKRGATVVIVGHNALKTQAAAQNITRDARAAGSKGTAEGFQADFSTFDAVRGFAKEFTAKYSSLKLLFNNAGVAPGILTGGANITAAPTGYESVFQINYLSPFLLTELLLPTMRKTEGARIINTGSTAHYTSCNAIGAPDDCLKDLTYLEGNMKMMPPFGMTYGVSKMANIQHAAGLAQRETKVQAFSVCPGLVSTGLTDKDANWTMECQMMVDMFDVHQGQYCPYTALQGAAVLATSAFAATQNGQWYQRYENCSNTRPVQEHGFTPDLVNAFYENTLKLVGLSGEDSILV